MDNQDLMEESSSLIAWEPGKLLRTISVAEVKYSRGFLRCNPEKWFPALGAHWLPLTHSLGIDLKVSQITTSLELPNNLDLGFGGRVDDEPVGLFCDEATKSIILSATMPGTEGRAGEIVLEYLACRLLASLGMSWSGPESSTVVFDSTLRVTAGDFAGVVAINGTINGNQFKLWLCVGRIMIERLDGLWRRQVQSTLKHVDFSGPAFIEIAQLAVPPTMLSDYLRSGTVIDLETKVTDFATLRVSNKSLLNVRLLNAGGKIALETLSSVSNLPILPDGTTRLAIELGEVVVDSAIGAEVSQSGAIFLTEIPIGAKVVLTINGESVGHATLGAYQGRFAITVS